MAIVNIVLSEEQTEGTKATVSQWLCQVGDYVQANDPVVELETDKVMMEVIAPESGVLAEICLDTGDEVSDSTPLGKINTEGTINKDDKQRNNNNPVATSIQPQERQSSVDSSRIVDTIDHSNNNHHISPSVRRLLAQHHIDINRVIGTGKNRRVTSRDIMAFLANKQTSSTQLTSSEHLPISSMRRSIANHMVDSLLHTAPHVTSVFNLDLSKVIEHRKQHKQSFKEKGVNLTFTSYFVAASVAAIKHQPLINSQLHADTIEIFNHINVGIGTNLEDAGLIVPVLKNCENKNLYDIASSLMDITTRARQQKLKPSDVQGGTFTISNHGVSGSLIATPIIINQPQSAILGIGKMEKRVVVQEVDGQDVITIKPMCYVTLTIDHRVLDAHQTNQFLSVFVETLENWQ